MQPAFIPLTFVTFEKEFLLLVTSNERAGKSTREEATKFDKFKRRKPRGKPRKKKNRKFQ